MEGWLKLATEVVILLTALVGLFKVTTIQTGRDPTSAALLSPLGPMGNLLTVIAFMLFPIVVMVGIRAGGYMMEKMDADVSNASALMPTLAATDTVPFTAARALVVAAMSADFRDDKMELLRRAIRLSIAERDFEAALVATDGVPLVQEKSELLAQLSEVAALNDALSVATAAASRIPLASEKNAALHRLADIIEQRSRTRPSPDSVATP